MVTTGFNNRAFNQPPDSPPFDIDLGFVVGTPSGKLEVMTDVVTPMFKILRSKGLITNNRMSYTSQERIFPPATVICTLTQNPGFPLTVGNQFQTLIGSVGSSIDKEITSVNLNANMQGLIDTDRHRFLASVQARNRVTPILVQSLVSLAELHKTFSLIANSVRTLHSFRKALSRGASLDEIYHILGGKFKSKPSKRSSVDPIYNRWLEYRYGWTPLIMEIQGALKALDKARVLKPRATVRGSSKESRDANWQKTENFFHSKYGSNLYSFQQIESVEVRSYVMFEADLSFQTARDFGFTEVPLAMWELVPYSFVVDWFIPIGDWIEALTPKLGIKVLAEGCVSTHRRFISRRVDLWSPSSDPGPRYDQSGFVSTIDSYTEVQKQRETSLNAATAFPQLNVKLNVKRALDAIALLGVGSKPKVRL